MLYQSTQDLVPLECPVNNEIGKQPVHSQDSRILMGHSE